MNIEKVNDNQIRCTLTKKELEERQIKLSELVYGSEKAKTLFQEMMQQANHKFGFESEDIPLMIEAIPLPTDSILLLITKVEYPEELDTRFSKFSEADPEMADDEEDAGDTEEPLGADDILGLFRKLQKKENLKQMDKSPDSIQQKPLQNLPVLDKNLTIIRMFEFGDLDQVKQLSDSLKSFYKGNNDLVKDERKKKFYLIVDKSAHSPEEFNRVCNMISEYGIQRNYLPSVKAYYEEHGKVILRNHALQDMAQLS